jgi:hypothetical protein
LAEALNEPENTSSSIFVAPREKRMKWIILVVIGVFLFLVWHAQSIFEEEEK